MNIGIPKEVRKGEARLAASVDSVKKFVQRGVEVLVERGAGESANVSDEMLENAGARLGTREEAFAADVVAKVTCPLDKEVGLLKPNSLLLTVMDLHNEGRLVLERLAKQGVSTFALDKIPRISRAQSLDVLSSQANIAGYKAVIEGAAHMPRMFPMMMTSAGTVPAARTFVLGAGVAGLQAIATAKRLGSQVEAFDVRPEVKDEITSLGAKFLELGLKESGAGEGGYAKQLSPEAQQHQREALAAQATRADLIITTALVPGRRSPVLVTEDAVKNMKAGSVIVDMAASQGGNCPLTVPDEVVVRHGVTIIGYTNLPSRIAEHASIFFARNVWNLMSLLLEGDEKSGGTKFKLDREDEIVAKSLVTHGGELLIPMPEPVK